MPIADQQKRYRAGTEPAKTAESHNATDRAIFVTFLLGSQLEASHAALNSKVSYTGWARKK